MRCLKCGYRLILVWVGGIPWYACPKCDKEELRQKVEQALAKAKGREHATDNNS